MSNETMRAVRINGKGGVEVLQIAKVERPPATAVRVRVRAAALNRADLLQREGKYPAPPECAGRHSGTRICG